MAVCRVRIGGQLCAQNSCLVFTFRSVFFQQYLHPRGYNRTLLVVAALRLVPWPSHFITDAGLSWCLSGKEATCQYRRHVFDPWTGRIPHAKSLCATTIEPLFWSPETTTTEARVLWSLCSAMREATAMRSPITATGEWILPASTREKPAHL